MLANYFKILLRNIRRERVYTLINVLGLAIGLAASIVIAIFIRGESNYDSSFENSERIYRVGISFMNLGEFASGPEKLKGVLDEQFAFVEKFTRIRRQGEMSLVYGESSYDIPEVYAVDSGFFDMFSYEVLEGDPGLVRDNAIVLSRQYSEIIFGNESPLGETVLLGKEEKPYYVTAIVDGDVKTHLSSTAWIPIYESLTDDENWQFAAFYNYFRTSESTTRRDIDDAFETLRRETIYPTLNAGLEYDEWKGADHAYRFIIHPIEDIYFHSKLSFELGGGGNLETVYVFTSIAFLVLIIAAINFVNLTTARSARRSREVGIRKSFGTTRKQLVAQFLFESVGISLIAMVLAFGFAELFLVVFEEVTSYPLLKSSQSTLELVLVTGLITLLTGLLAGIYPALYLTSFNPSQVLKPVKLITASRAIGRDVLVIFQFTVSIVLIVSALFIYKQLNFLKQRDLGFNKEQVMVVSNIHELGDNARNFKQTIDGQSFVSSSSLSTRMPAGRTKTIWTFKSNYMEGQKSLNYFSGDHDFIETLDIELISGRGFSKDIVSDSNSVILNEAAVRELLLEDPLGELLNNNLTVIGVVKDFNFESLERRIEPAVIGLSDDGFRLAVKVQKGMENRSIEFLESTWMGFSPDEPIQYYFLESNFLEYLEKDEATAKIITSFTVLAIFISCLGLFGLAAYTVERRSKEIGVRKVLGASSAGITYLLASGFSVPVLISFVIALPVSILAVKSWLSNYAYQTTLSPSIFMQALLAILIFAWVTVAYYAIMTAVQNPVKSLREE